MLQDLLIAILGILAVIALMAHAPGTAVLFIIIGGYFMYIRSKYDPVLEKQLNQLAGWLVRVLAGLALVTVIIGLALSAPLTDAAFFGSALGLSLLPLTLPLALRGKFARSHAALDRHHAIRVLRSALTADAAEFALILLSLVGLA